MNYDPYAVGERIQSLRKECELTQDQLAIDLNISDRYMRNLERGERVPSIDLFVELRERFGASLDWYNPIGEIKIVSSQTVIWLCRFPKHSNIEILTGAESGKIACLVSVRELLTM